MTEWIKCSEQIPPEGDDILLYCAKSGIKKGVYYPTMDGYSVFYTECLQSHREFKPTYWMEIPDPPQFN